MEDNKTLDKSFQDVKMDFTENKEGKQAPTPVKPIIQPMDKVKFHGEKASVIGVDPDGIYTIIQNGMTIECSAKELELYDKVDNVDTPMKFDKTSLKLLENQMIPCNMSVNGILYMDESIYVNFDEWKRKKGKQNVHVISESYKEYNIPKNNITLTKVPLLEDNTDGYIDGVVVGHEGDATRKIKVNAVEYAESSNDDDQISVLYITDNGYKDGTLPKKDIKTLSV